MKRASGHLTIMQQRFVSEYQIDRNQTEAALRAGYGNGTNRKTAASIGSQMMRIPHVRTAIESAIVRVAEKTETSSEYVRRKLKEESEGHGKDCSQAARVRALELLGKLNGDFVEDRKNSRSPLQDFDIAQLERLEQELNGLTAADDSGAAGRVTH